MTSDDYLPTESTLARQKRDTEDEDKVIIMFKRLNVFTKDNSLTKLQNIATKDFATDVIQTSLLHAETKTSIACWQHRMNRNIPS